MENTKAQAILLKLLAIKAVTKNLNRFIDKDRLPAISDEEAKVLEDMINKITLIINE